MGGRYQERLGRGFSKESYEERGRSVKTATTMKGRNQHRERTLAKENGL